MTPTETLEVLLKLGGYFAALIAFVVGVRYAITDLRAAHERVIRQTAAIEEKVDSIQRTLGDIQIKAAGHDQRVRDMQGHLSALDGRITFLERGRST